MANKDYKATLKSSGQTLTGDTLAEAVTFNAQCFLIQHMGEIAPKAQVLQQKSVEVYRDTPAADRATKVGGLASPNSAELSPSGYRYVAPVLSDNTYTAPKTFSTLVKPERAMDMLDLTTDKMAMLIPKLRIYKVEYGEKQDPSDPELLIPDLNKARDVEVIFDDFVQGATLNKMFENRQGRLSDTGIKSFKWSLKGVNPADVDKNIEAQLSIYFNDVSTLFTDASRNPVYQAGRAGGSSFLDLIIYAPHKKIKNNAQKSDPVPTYLHYDGKFFEIKAEVGWQVPPNKGSFFTSGELDVIRATSTPLYLQLTKHRFDFREDGSAMLVIDYRGRYAHLESRFDLFGIPPNLDLLASVQGLQSELAELGAEQPAGGFLGVGADPAIEALNERIKEKEELLEEAQGKLNVYLNERYSRIFDYLIGTGARDTRLMDAFATPLQLRAMSDAGGEPTEMSMQDYRNLTARARTEPGASGSPVSEAMLAGGAEGTKPFFEYATSNIGAYKMLHTEGFFDYTGAVTLHTEFVKAQAEKGIYTKLVAASADPEKDKDTSNPIAGQTGARRAGRPGAGQQGLRGAANAALLSGAEPITFFLLGDLLEGLIEVTQTGGIKEEIQRSRMGLITTDLEFINVGVFYDAVTGYQEEQTAQYKGGETWHQRAAFKSPISPQQFFKKLAFRELSFSKEDKKKLYRPINIASIPIQYDYFVDWYIKKVVKPKVQTYYFNRFIADLLRDLVMPALSGRCFYGIPQTHYHLTQLNVLADVDSPFSKALYTPPGTQSETGTVFTSALVENKALPIQLTSRRRGGAGQTLGTRGGTTGFGSAIHRNFKVLLVTDPAYMSFEAGDYREDREKGIYHFIVGADRGLLKSASFQRVDAPYMPEARISRDRVAGAEQLRELYNVTLKLYGAPLIKPGQYVYVTPAPVGFGSPKSKRSIARYLGIGGYHLVTSVENNISSKGYETTVKALHQALPYIATEHLVK